MFEAIIYDNAAIVEILLKDYHANPNVVTNDNMNALCLCCGNERGKDTLSIMKLLAEYEFDFAKFVNQAQVRGGINAFHCLCGNPKINIKNKIACIKYLLNICEKTPNCSLDILAKDEANVCGIHSAIAGSDVELVRYLLENVYFPNNDKMNKNGIAFMNMKPFGAVSLAQFASQTARGNVEIFRLLVSYGMNVKLDAAFIIDYAIKYAAIEILKFMLTQNLCPNYTTEEIATGMCDTVNNEVMQTLYNYGLKHGLINFEDKQHLFIIEQSATVNLPKFKAVLSIVLAHSGINNLKQCKQSNIVTPTELEWIAQQPQTKQHVKSFIEALINDNDEAMLQLEKASSLEVTITCIYNHEIKNSKISNSQQRCSVCYDNSDAYAYDTQSSNGFQCDECKSFICDDCVIVQRINKQIDMVGDERVKFYFESSEQYALSILNKVFEYRWNKNLFVKVK